MAVSFFVGGNRSTSHWQTLSHNVVSSSPHMSRIQTHTTLVVIGTDCICICKSNYNTITTMTSLFSRTYYQIDYNSIGRTDSLHLLIILISYEVVYWCQSKPKPDINVHKCLEDEGVSVVVFKATFNNISALSWRKDKWFKTHVM